MSSTEKQTTGLRGGPVSERLQVLALFLLTLVTAGLALVVVIDFFDDEQPTAAGAQSDPAETAASEPSATVAPETEEPTVMPRAVFIGDEWAQGAGASGADKSFTALTATQLGWTFDVDAVAGSGWTKDAPGVPNSRFVDRAARLTDGDNAPDVVVFSAQTPSGSPLKEVEDLISQTVEAVRTQVPDATIVVVLPVANNQADLLCPPVADDLICIDTFAEGWLTPGDRGQLMNKQVGAPNDAGHERLAGFLSKDLRDALPDLTQ
ncbi:hypothetical protein GCM10027020_21700 [Nocardioides salsibiostraticola]